jgi:hypothetical protein
LRLCEKKIRHSNPSSPLRLCVFARKKYAIPIQKTITHLCVLASLREKNTPFNSPPPLCVFASLRLCVKKIRLSNSKNHHPPLRLCVFARKKYAIEIPPPLCDFATLREKNKAFKNNP